MTRLFNFYLKLYLVPVLHWSRKTESTVSTRRRDCSNDGNRQHWFKNCVWMQRIRKEPLFLLPRVWSFSLRKLLMLKKYSIVVYRTVISSYSMLHCNIIVHKDLPTKATRTYLVRKKAWFCSVVPDSYNFTEPVNGTGASKYSGYVKYNGQLT
jgi:hypothetical protein